MCGLTSPSIREEAARAPGREQQLARGGEKRRSRRRRRRRSRRRRRRRRRRNRRRRRRRRSEEGGQRTAVGLPPKSAAVCSLQPPSQLSIHHPKSSSSVPCVKAYSIHFSISKFESNAAHYHPVTTIFLSSTAAKFCIFQGSCRSKKKQLKRQKRGGTHS